MQYTVIYIKWGIGRANMVFNANSVLNAINQFMALNLCSVEDIITVTADKNNSSL